MLIYIILNLKNNDFKESLFAIMVLFFYNTNEGGHLCLQMIPTI